MFNKPPLPQPGLMIDQVDSESPSMDGNSHSGTTRSQAVSESQPNNRQPNHIYHLN